MQEIVGLIPGSGRSPGEGNGNPLRYSFFLIFNLFILIGSKLKYCGGFCHTSTWISHCSNILEWEIPWTEDPGRLVYGVTESDMTEHACALGISHSILWEKKLNANRAPGSVFIFPWWQYAFLSLLKLSIYSDNKHVSDTYTVSGSVLDAVMEWREKPRSRVLLDQSF